jgi:hypothetical protein
MQSFWILKLTVHKATTWHKSNQGGAYKNHFGLAVKVLCLEYSWSNFALHLTILVDCVLTWP